MAASSLSAKAMPAHQLKSFLLLCLLLLLLFLHSSSVEANGFIGDGTRTACLVRQLKPTRKLMMEDMGAYQLDYFDGDHNTKHEKGAPGAGGRNP